MGKTRNVGRLLADYFTDLPDEATRETAMIRRLAPALGLVGCLAVGCSTPTGGNPVAAAAVGNRSATAAPAHSTPTPTATATEPPAPPQVFTGKGDNVLKITDPGLGIVVFECPKCTGNTIVDTNGSERLLVNTIGPYSGKRWINTNDGSRTTQVTVKAHGSWKLTVGGLDLASTVKGSEAKGHGDDVLVWFGHASAAAVTHEGEGNFVVQVLSVSSGMDLAINEIGSYTGTVPMNLPGMVQVTAEGTWVIAAGR